MTRTYTAEISGSSWSVGPTADFQTITAARKWAESYGNTADQCVIHDRKGELVAVHCRDQNGDGMRWYKAPAFTLA